MFAGRDGPIHKFHYSAEAEYLMNATEAESLFYFLVSKGLLNKSATLCDIILTCWLQLVFQVHIHIG